ncbi:hypothetical protein ACFQ1Q_02175 [Winogradskyella litorisediminis]|uniref:Mrr-like domain-containing protein n=1 Tax=Winogradskyella litorisediminis TaxID=1156618 RepID=A0ABW3N527_9FLAO
MISPKRIHPPQNWQSFELLTLKLWGEIWNVPNEIEFNSESGSKQKGVDICCIPKNEKEYFGIQCKNTKLFCKYGKIQKLTKVTIDEEIEKAKEFKPKLEQLVIATSFTKDGELEEYLREINLKHIKSGIFRVQICFWEYFSRKIQEYDNIENWYLNNQNFVSQKSVYVSFENDKSEKNVSPEFIKNNVTYRLQTEDEKLEEKTAFQKAYKEFQSENKLSFINRIFNFSNKISDKILTSDKILINGVDIKSQEYIESTYPKQKLGTNIVPKFLNNLIKDEQEFSFKIKIKNDGRSVIDDFKLSFQIEGDFENVQVNPPRISELKTYNATTWINDRFGLFEPSKNFIIQKDTSISKKIIVTPKLAKEGEIKIKWTLLARDFNDEGELKINIKPKYIESQKTMYVLRTEDCKSEIEYNHKMIEGNYQLNW